VALAYTVARLKAGGFVLFDVQFLTGHLKRFGAIEVSQDEYLAELQKALELTPDFYSLPEAASTGEVLQLIAQTS
jgi:leucyl/phenylalanyl-tRNA--protein transferase